MRQCSIFRGNPPGWPLPAALETRGEALVRSTLRRFADRSRDADAVEQFLLGADLAKSTKDRADYLELRQQAQFPAPEAELVERVREVLARP